jgi:hypothetical protein
MYIYGGLYPLMIAPWINIIQPIILIPRLFSALSALFSIFLMFLLLRKRGASALGALFGSAILAYALCLVFKITLAGPDLTGVFVFLLGFFLFSHFGGSLPFLVLSALCGVCGFFIKQYYVLPALGFGIYLLLFQSKKTGAVFLGSLFLIGLVIALPLRFLAPLYFRYTILHFLHVVSNDQGHALFQTSVFFQWFFGLIALFFIGSAIQAFQRLRRKEKKIRFWARNPDKPVLSGVEIDGMTWNFFCMLLVLVFILGKNTGNDHTYFLELLLPFLLLAGIPVVETTVTRPGLRFGCQLIWLTCLIPLAAGSNMDLQKFSAKYEEMEIALQSCRTVYGAAYANQVLLEEEKPIYDSGHSDLGYTIILPYEVWRARLLGGHDGSIENKWNTRNRQIGESIARREFSCLAVYGDTTQLGGITLSDFYTPKYRIPDFMEWDVVTHKVVIDIVIWVPKER